LAPQGRPVHTPGNRHVGAKGRAPSRLFGPWDVSDLPGSHDA
jgi:hypothetical protein